MSIVSSLKSSLLNIMGKLLMSLPVETLQEVPGYNTVQHRKALAAYKKILICSQNDERSQKKRSSLKETEPQSSDDINPLCLSPNDNHYRFIHHAQNRCSVGDKNTGVTVSEHQEANTKIVPDNNAAISESMKISNCIKSLKFSSSTTHERNVNSQVLQINKRNIPSISPTLPHGNSSEASDSSDKPPSMQSCQTNSCKQENKTQDVPLRKFNFGSHRKLASGSDNSTPASSVKNSGFRVTNTRSLCSPMNISGTSKTIASGNATTSAIEESDMKSLWQNDSEFGESGIAVKTSAPSVHPKSVNLGK